MLELWYGRDMSQRLFLSFQQAEQHVLRPFQRVRLLVTECLEVTLTVAEHSVREFDALQLMFEAVDLLS